MNSEQGISKYEVKSYVNYPSKFSLPYSLFRVLNLDLNLVLHLDLVLDLVLVLNLDLLSLVITNSDTLIFIYLHYENSSGLWRAFVGRH